MVKQKSWFQWIGVFTLALLMVVVTACSSGSSTATNTTAPASTDATASTDSGQPKDGGSLIIAVAADPQVLNPNYAGDRVSLTIDQALYAPLFQVNKGKKTFYLADSLDLSKDNLTYTLTLKKGLTWHDGEKLTADDVVFTINKILDESQHSFLRSSFVIGGKPVQVTKINDTTIQFKLAQVSPAFEAALVQVSPIPKHIFENETDIEKSTKNNNPIGSGPFKFKEYKTGEYITLERFDNYFGGKPHLDSVTYRIAKDTNAANLALQNGEINVKYLDPQDVSTIQATGNFDIQAYSEGRLAYLMFNENSDTGVLNKKEVRQAISYALSRDEIIQVAYTSTDYAEPARSPFTPDALYFDNDVTTYDNNIEKAKQLLQQAGVSNLKLRFIVSSGNKSQEAQSLYIQQKLKEIGIDVELQNMDSSAWSNKFVDPNAKDYELAISGYIMGYDPDAYRILYTSNESSNYTHYNNKKVDQLFVEGSAEADTTKRAAIYKELQEIIAADAPIYPMAYTKTIVAIDKKYGGLDKAILKPVVIFEDLSKIYLKQ
ncbi:ABC transporter substrate-binding protein [Paenibacillus kyungheensis]|uniref:ABC transporter substrate-binding protein n=1 Tax=Paenibacillus kyungheensis TaxID=1452732 RepID=A0AAX3M699_9BACL|nr:ABC transporter substrate-binding protein [Paenibacillus kyungheensis]WCT57480.1 ABC transporter substrate-binding protein [Paenibacillus kyungheensis]